MIRYMIKNNFKLMSRNKWIIFLMILGPILTIAILSSAFADLMKSYEGIDNFTTGYRVEEGSRFSTYMDGIVEAGEEAGITLVEYPTGEPKELMDNNDLAGFVVFADETYTLYESEELEVEGMTLEYFLNRVMREAANQSLQMVFPIAEEEKMELPVQALDYMPAVDSGDYYGIIYIVYYSWCGALCASNVLSNEKKYGIGRKYQVTAISGWKMYLSKWVPLVLVLAAGIGVAAVITAFLFEIHWGNVLVAAALVLLSLMASAAYGLMLYYISQNLAITIIVLFTTVWFMGFFGGSFETYLFSSWSESVKSLSPIYHVNRALVENAAMGHSSYTNSCIVYTLVITVVCSAVAIVVDEIRKRGKA